MPPGRALRIGLSALTIAVLAGGCLRRDAPTGFGPSEATEYTADGSVAGTQPVAPAAPDAYATRRARLVEEAIVGAGIEDPAVVRAMATVPRHLFVPERFRDQAYNDNPLPIGYGQTISQPWIVARMTEVLALAPDDKVLEVGTGSGYQAAVLAELVDRVYTIEIVGALAERAEQTLRDLGYDSVKVRHGDGYFGWPEEAPFDKIIVTAAPDHIPPPLRDQLADGGRLVIPVGPVGAYQELWLVGRRGDRFSTTALGGVAFVPLTRSVR